MGTGVGIEVEVENVPPLEINQIDGWDIKNDGSLRDNGREFVTKFGLILENVPEILDNLFDIMAVYKTYFTFNERTSIHVHLDVRKLSSEELKSLIVLYTIFEDSLFKLAGESRKHNIFCVPIRYIDIGTIGDNRYFSGIVMLWKKYSAMNLCRIADFGTVEFRHMEGHKNKLRVVEWVFILAALLDYCRTIPFESLKNKILNLKVASQYDQFTEEIFGSLAKCINIVPHEFDMAISDSKLFFSIVE